MTSPLISTDPVRKHPNEDRLYYMDFTAELEADEVIEDVQTVDIQDEDGNPLGDLESDPLSHEPNATEFRNYMGVTVEVGKAALFRGSGGVAGTDYYALVTVVTNLGNTIPRLGLFEVRSR